MAYGEKSDSRYQLIDTETPSVPRMYDWLLGGTDNYQTDRDACAELLKIAPSTQRLARNNRTFLQRVVRALASEGITQFLDHGSGLPTQDNVHEVAQRVHGGSKVIYVDNDPMVLAHARTRLHTNDKVKVVAADFRDTHEIRQEVGEFFDWGKPIAALFVSVLHCIPDEPADGGPSAVIRRVAAQLPVGSYMVICQLVSDSAEVRDGVTRLMEEVTGGKWGRVRTREEVQAFFDGMEIVEPHLVDVTDWRPDAPTPPQELRPDDWIEWGGVARIV